MKKTLLLLALPFLLLMCKKDDCTCNDNPSGCIEDGKGTLKISNRLDFKVDVSVIGYNGGDLNNSPEFKETMFPGETWTDDYPLDTMFVIVHGDDGNAPFASNSIDTLYWRNLQDCEEVEVRITL